MATITKRVDRGIEPAKRYQFWKSSENADDGTIIAAADVFMIQDSLGRPASYFYVETDASANLVIRFNSRVVEYKLRSMNLNWPNPQPDLENPIVRFDTSMESIEVAADGIWELDGVLPISDITIVSWDAGTFEIFVS